MCLHPAVGLTLGVLMVTVNGHSRSKLGDIHRAYGNRNAPGNLDSRHLPRERKGILDQTLTVRDTVAYCIEYFLGQLVTRRGITVHKYRPSQSKLTTRTIRASISLWNGRELTGLCNELLPLQATNDSGQPKEAPRTGRL